MYSIKGIRKNKAMMYPEVEIDNSVTELVTAG